MTKEKVWTREFASMTIINSLFIIIFFLFIVTITPYAKEQFHVSISMAGFAASIFVVGSLIGRILSGGLIEKYGPIKVLEITIILFIVISSGYFFVFNIESLFVVRVLQGFTTGIIGTATGTVSMQAIPVSRRAEGISYYSSSAVIGAAVGPFVGIYFLSLNHGYQWIFALNVLVGILSYILLLLTKRYMTSFKAVHIKQKFSLHRFIEIKALPISIIALIFGFCFSSVTSYLVLYSEVIQLVKVASYYFFVHATFITLTRFFTGKWIDTKGANVVIYPCLVLFGGGLLLYSQVQTWWMFLIAGALISTGFGNFNSGAQTLAVKYSESSRLGTATATYFMFIDIGSGIGPYVLGAILEQTGYRVMYAIVALCALVTIPLYYFFYGRKKEVPVKSATSLSTN